MVINDGNRLVLARKDSAVTNFHLTAVGSNAAIQDLKLYKVQDYSDPASPPPSDGTVRQLDQNSADLILFTQDGAATLVSLDGVTDILGVRTAINATGKAKAEINIDKTGLKLTDLTAPAVHPPIFRVDSVNGS